MAEDATPQKYPGWRYHVRLPAVVVHSEDEEHALPEGYVAHLITEAERAEAAAKAAEGESSPRSRSHR
jgi:hypothetical protein